MSNMNTCQTQKIPLIVLLLLVVGDSHGATAICQGQFTHKNEMAASSNYQASVINHSQSAVRTQKYRLNWHPLKSQVRAGQQSRFAYSLGYQYWAQDFLMPAAIRPQTNGDLHQLGMSLHWRWYSSDRKQAVRLSLNPKLALSSNALKRPGRMDFSHLQIPIAAVWQYQVDSVSKLHLGLCYDELRGRTQVLPLLAFHLKLSEKLQFNVGYPQTRLDYRIDSNWTLAASYQQQGYRWRVFDKSFDHLSTFRRYGRLTKLTLKTRLGRTRHMQLSLLKHHHERISYLTQLGVQQSLPLSGETYLMLEMVWTLPAH